MNGVNQGGQTALMLAALMGHSEIVSLLLEAGADVDFQDNRGLTASDWAQRRGFAEISELLAKALPLEERLEQTKSTAAKTIPEPELEPEAPPDAQASTEEKERRRAVGFGPAAIAILKATAKAPDDESELAHPTPVHEDVSRAEPLPHPQVKQVAKSHADRLPSASEARPDAAPLGQQPVDSPVKRLTQKPLRRQPDHLAPTAGESAPKSGRIHSEHPGPIARETHAIWPEEPARRESEEVLPTARHPEPFPAGMRAEDSEPAPQKTLTQTGASIRTEDAARRKPDQTLPGAIKSEGFQVERRTGSSDPGRKTAPPLWPDEARLAADEAETASPETLQSRMETERIFEEARQRVEQEVRRKVQFETRSIGGIEQPRESDTKPDGTNLKRCPKCNTIYEDDVRTVCVYDSERLVSVDGALSNASQTFDRPTLWALVAITLVGSICVTYLVTNYVNWENRSASPAAAITEAPAKAEENQPVVGGELVGKEASVPKAEYPEVARNERIADTVVVIVRVNKNGRVISARALNGNRQLRAAAIAAAKKATFSQEKLASDEGITTGTITYTFKP